MTRALVTFLTLLLLWVLAAEANDCLAPLHVYLFVGGLFVTFASLHLPLRAGLAAVLAGGLLCDAVAPAPFFGGQTLLFGGAWLAIFRVRDRLPRAEPAVRVLVALLANLGLFLLFSLLRMRGAPIHLWGRLFFDLLCSQAAIALVGPWFFALQHRALGLARTEPAALD
jgi:hypothetical protein